MKENRVVFKGEKNGIVIILDSSLDFNDLKNILTKKVLDAKEFFEGANTAITFKGRDMSEKEEAELLEIVLKNSGLDISYVNKSIPVAEKKKWTPTPASSSSDNSPTAPNVFNALQNTTMYHKGSVRSGQTLSFDGSLVIMGDVNPGGEVKATGNIIVLGKLKGIVHAGAKGNSDCFVSALYMNPTQLIIAGVITYFPEEQGRKFTPEHAYIKNGQIFVEPLVKF